jgi:hypothetical protein
VGSRACIGGLSADYKLPGTRDPTFEVIDRCPATGRPLGIVRDAAMQLVTAAVLEPSVGERRRAMEAACAYLLQRVGGLLLQLGEGGRISPSTPA